MFRAEPLTDQDGLIAADRDQLEARGIGVEEARRQLALLRDPPPKTKLARPARIGDGILPLPEGTEADRLAEEGRSASRAGRLIRFVPASGAASRLFAELRTAQAAGFPVNDRSSSVSRTPGNVFPLTAVRPSSWTATATRPRPWSLSQVRRRRARTALEEHLVEAALSWAVAARRRSTSPSRSVTVRRSRRCSVTGCRCSNDGWDAASTSRSPTSRRLPTGIAVDADGKPFRIADDPAAPLLVRPEATAHCLASPVSGRPGLRADRGEEHRQRSAGDGPGRVGSGHADPCGMARELARGSGRPARVCGVVPAVGTAGGGPFWVHETSGASGTLGGLRLQIVETSQIELEDREPAAIWPGPRTSTRCSWSARRWPRRPGVRWRTTSTTTPASSCARVMAGGN